MWKFIKKIYHFCVALCGVLIYRFPSREIFVIGVTGTKGKSTVCEIMNAILETAGYKTALVSSVRVKIGDESYPNDTSNTMPGRFFLQRFLRRAIDAGCRYVIIEVTSQGVEQYRHRFIDFDAALVTNLHPEHIESHGSFEHYRAAKVRFFQDVCHYSRKKNKFFFINALMNGSEYFSSVVEGCGDVQYFSREDFIQHDLVSHYAMESQQLKSLLSGWLQHDFNVENVAAAVAFTTSQGVGWATIEQALRNFHGVPGRMEYVQREPFAVVVDYAHTPDSLRAVYGALRKQSKGRLICVLGAAGGGRDQWKRPEMGKIAAEFCDAIFLTNEDPFDEDPMGIILQIEKGTLETRNVKRETENIVKTPSPDVPNIPVRPYRPGGEDCLSAGHRERKLSDDTNGKIVTVEKILDRKEAIKRALVLAKSGDTVVLTGKGSESFIRLAHGKKIPWNERGVVEELLQ